MADVYDLQHDPRYRDVLTCPSPKDGEPVSTSFLPVKSWDDVLRRVRGEALRTDHTYGLMGRLPDYVNAFVRDLDSAEHVLRGAPSGLRRQPRPVLRALP